VRPERAANVPRVRLRTCLAIPLAGVLLIGIANQADVARPGPYCLPVKKELRSQALSFSLPALDGSTLTFSTADGRPTIVAFFATWCRPCSEEMPALLDVARRYESQGVRTVLVNDEEPPAPIRAFSKKFGIDLPIAMDANGTTFKLFGLRGIPSTLFFNANGVLTCYVTDSLAPKQLDNEASAAAGGWMP